MFRKILALTLAFAYAISYNVCAKSLYNYKETTVVASGVNVSNLKRLDSAGWQNINIAEIDLNNEYVQTKVITSSTGLNTLETVKKLAEENNTTVAINGDFFAWNSTDRSKGSTLGTIMNDGILLSSSSEEEGMFTFAIDKFGKIICENIKTDITLKAANGNEMKIKHLNKYDSLAQPVIYTSAFGGVTGGSYNNILEVVIVDDVITELRRNMDGVEIPENGYVIRHLPEFDPFLVENLAVRDQVEITFSTNFDLESFETMTGGGTMLVTQGQPAKITHNVSGANPRTVIACDESRSKLYLITIDGRQSNAKGYTLNQLTEFLIEIGMYDAMNLDGGGSTTMIVKQKGEQTVTNNPSENSLRKVASAVGIVSNAPVGNILSGFEIDEKEGRVFKGTTKTFAIKNAIDEYGNPFEGDMPEITYKIEDDYGYFDNNILYAKKAGYGIKVVAKYNDFVAECEIDILDKVSDLMVYPSHFDLSDLPQFEIVAKDDNGIIAPVETNDITLKTLNQFEKNVIVAGNSKKITFSDIICDFEKSDFSATSYPSNSTSEVSIEKNEYKSGKASAKLEYDFSHIDAEKTGAAYLDFNSPLNISGKQKLGVWVYSPTILNQWIRAEFTDKNGEVLRETLIDNVDFSGWKYVVFDVPADAKQLTKLYVVQNSLKEKTKGFVLLDSLSVAGFQFDEDVIEVAKNDTKSGKMTIGVIADMPEDDTLLSKVLSSKVESELKENDCVFSIKNHDFYSIEEIKNNGYNSFVKENSLFVTLNNSGGYTSVAQWLKFETDIQKQVKNIFIFLNETPELMKNDLEAQMFKQKLESISKEKDVFVFYPDYHTSIYKDFGATFVSVGGFNSKSPLSAVNLLEELMFPQIVINDNNVEINFFSIN